MLDLTLTEQDLVIAALELHRNTIIHSATTNDLTREIREVLTKKAAKIDVLRKKIIKQQREQNEVIS